MILYFLRHGIAADRDDPKYKNDSLRPLTDEGREKMRNVSLGMKKSGLTFDIILSSPYVRARQTAETVAKAYKINNKEIHITKNLLPPASIEELLKEVHTRFPISKNILLVGHEPHLSEMISCLLQPKAGPPMAEKCHAPLSIDFKKGGLCCLSIDGLSSKNASLRWLLTPAQLGLMAR